MEKQHDQDIVNNLVSLQNQGDMSLDELKDILSTTIACDDTNKVIVALGMLATYIEGDQLTICLLGPSSSGKTYLAQEVAKYFPKEDVITLSGATPTAMRYGYDEEDDEGIFHSYYSGKIFIFAEMPNSTLLSTLRSTLSHDSECTTFLSTSGGATGNRKVQKIQYHGYPSVIFCSANLRIDDQEATRSLLLSPEISSKKISEATRLAAIRRANPEKYEKELNSNPKRQKLIDRIKYIKALGTQSVIIPDAETKVYARFYNDATNPSSRDSRDITYIESLIKAITLLNLGSRLNTDTGIVSSTDSDIDEGFRLWNNIKKTQGSGVVPVVRMFYDDFFLPAYKRLSASNVANSVGISIDQITSFWKDKGIKLPAPSYTIMHDFMPAMERMGLVTKVNDPNDGRRKLFCPSNKDAILYSNE